MPSKRMNQIIHVDYMCNECGNCRSFCPYESAPYLDKFTLFANLADFENSKNSGFVVTNVKTGTCKVRLGNGTFDYKLGEKSANIPDDIGELISTVISSYSYLLMQESK